MMVYFLQGLSNNEDTKLGFISSRWIKGREIPTTKTVYSE